MSEHRQLIDRIYRIAKRLSAESVKGLSQVGEVYKAEHFTGIDNEHKKKGK